MHRRITVRRIPEKCVGAQRRRVGRGTVVATAAGATVEITGRDARVQTASGRQLIAQIVQTMMRLLQTETIISMVRALIRTEFAHVFFGFAQIVCGQIDADIGSALGGMRLRAGTLRSFLFAVLVFVILHFRFSSDAMGRKRKANAVRIEMKNEQWNQ